MEDMGWDDNVMHPIAGLNNPSSLSSAWISSQQPREIQKYVDRDFNSTMWKNIIHPGFSTLDDTNVTSYAFNEADSIIFGEGNTPICTTNAFSHQKQLLSSSSGSTQLSDYVLRTNTPMINAYFVEDHHSSPNESINTNSINTRILPGAEGDGISSNDSVNISILSSRKRKSIEAADDDGMIHFNNVSKKRKMSDPIELTFGSSINEDVLECIPSSSAQGGSGGFSLNAPSLPKSSNINFKLCEITSDNDAPDSETILEMKEMIYRAAAFRPVNLGMDEVVEKPKRKNVKISSDPQTAAARQRRERISDRIRVLQRIVPGGNKMDTATMLDEAANYLKFLRSQVKALEQSVPTGGFGFTSYNFLT